MNLTSARLVYGAVLATAPAFAVRVVGSRPLDRRALVVVRVLGVRHLAQAALVGPGAGPLTMLAATLTDALHAASMVGLGAVSHARRRVAVCDAIVGTVFTVTDATAARRRGRGGGASRSPDRTVARPWSACCSRVAIAPAMVTGR